MPIDATIPLGVKTPDAMQSLSGLLNVATNAQALKKAQATFDADVAQRQADSSSAQSAATVHAATVQPLIEQQATATKKAQFGLQKDYMGTALDTAAGLTQDPRLAAGPNYSDEAAANAITEAENQMIAKGVPPVQAKMATAPLYMKVHEPGAVQQMLKNTITGNLGAQGQAGAITPSGVGVSSGIQSAMINTNPLAGPVGQPVAGTTTTQLVPLGQQQSLGVDVNGNPIVGVKDAYGNIQAPRALPGSTSAPQLSFPAGESPQTKTALEQESINAKNAALGAPQLHDINKTIMSEVDKGLNTGTLGRLTQQVASGTGFNLGAESSTGYNLLGKMLERSALTAAQSMGPHTNAGLEAAVRANGSLEYTPQAIKTIARLNDALTTGSEKYAQGLQQAIAAGGSVFSKRQFDQQWSQNASVNALKLLNASRNGDKEGVQEVLQTVGGPGSMGAQKLGQQIQNLQSLTNKGAL